MPNKQTILITPKNKCWSLIHQLKDDDAILCGWITSAKAPIQVDWSTIVAWLKMHDDENISRAARAKRIHLRALLLGELEGFFTPPPENTLKKLSFFAKVKNKLKSISVISLLVWLLAGGIFFSVCAGFDGVASILGLFPTAPLAVAIGVGIVFFSLSLFLFLGFDLIQIAQNLDVSLGWAPKQLKNYLDQTQHIKFLRKYVNKQIVMTSEMDELMRLRDLALMLKQRFDAMEKARDAYRNKSTHPLLKSAKVFAVAITGGFSFVGGFFAGHAMAMMISSFFFSAITPTFWPLIVIGVIGGLAAVSAYFFLERPGIENLIGGLFRLDEDTVNLFTDKDKSAKEAKKITQVIAHVKGKIEDKKKLKMNTSKQDISMFSSPREYHGGLKRSCSVPRFFNIAKETVTLKSECCFDEGDGNLSFSC